MRAETYPIQCLVLAISGWVNRHQADVISYLVEENRVLKEQLGGKKLQLSDDQRRRLAAKAKLLGRKWLDKESETSPLPESSQGMAISNAVRGLVES